MSEIQKHLDRLAARLREQPQPMNASSNGHSRPTGPGPSSIPDESIIDKCRAADNAPKFVDLFDHGDTSGNRGDDSAADFALLGILKFYTQDPDQLERLMRDSALARPKWGEKRAGRSWLRYSIDNALKGSFETYEWGRQGSHPLVSSSPSSPLVHLQDRFRLTGYDTVHENTDLCTSVVRKGAREPRKGAALQRRLRHAPLAGALGEREGRARPEDCLEPRMRLPNGARRHPRLQPEGSSRPRSEVLAPEANPRRLRRRERREVTRDAPPLPEGVRIPDEPVDPGDGRRGGLRRGTHRRARLRRDDPGDAFAPAGGSLDARQAVDNLPGPPVRTKKGGATD